jgi:PhnB protein
VTTIHDVYARLVVEGADAALAFYRDAFGAEVVERFAGPDGRVQHAAMALGPFTVAVKDAGDGDPAPTGPTPVIMALYVDDPDAVAERVVAGGGTVVHPVTDHDHGERGGRVRDPWGHQWMLAREL